MPSANFRVSQLAWATDLHLNFLRGDALEPFLESLAASPAGAIALTGDISDGIGLETHLALIAQRVAKPLFVVLGNHDRYHTTFAEVEEQMTRSAVRFPQLHRLTGSEIFELGPHSALLGIDGWADGQSGVGVDSPVVLNDTIRIDDFAILPRAAQWTKMADLARASAQTIRPALDTALASYHEVILLTHVPPFVEACWHEGRISGPDFLPHFCNARLGEVIHEACARHPATQLTVLCGHTHSTGEYREGNLTVLTGGAIYGNPRIDRVLAIGAA